MRKVGCVPVQRSLLAKPASWSVSTAQTLAQAAASVISLASLGCAVTNSVPTMDTAMQQGSASATSSAATKVHSVTFTAALGGRRIAQGTALAMKLSISVSASRGGKAKPATSHNALGHRSAAASMPHVS